MNWFKKITIKKQDKNGLPYFFEPIMWSYNFTKIDAEKDKKTIILNAINYGDLKHWQWLGERYGVQQIKEFFSQIPVSAVRPPALKLAQIIFSLEKLNYVPRGVK